MGGLRTGAVCLALLMLTGCGMEAPAKDLAEWAIDEANQAMDGLMDEANQAVDGLIDGLKNAEHQGGPFENNLDSARAYLLAQMEEKYGMPFTVVGDEDLTNYGPFAGASYTCDVAPVDAPEQVTTALVSQTKYQKVRDSYAVYFFKEEAEAPVLELCGAKDYVIDQRVSLEMPGTARVWSPEDDLDEFLSGSGAYVKVVLRLEDGLENRAYAEQILDFLNSIGQLPCNLEVQARANKTYIFFARPQVLDGFDPSSYTLEEIEEDIELLLKIGNPT